MDGVEAPYFPQFARAQVRGWMGSQEWAGPEAGGSAAGLGFVAGQLGFTPNQGSPVLRPAALRTAP